MHFLALGSNSINSYICHRWYSENSMCSCLINTRSMLCLDPRCFISDIGSDCKDLYSGTMHCIINDLAYLSRSLYVFLTTNEFCCKKFPLILYIRSTDILSNPGPFSAFLLP